MSEAIQLDDYVDETRSDSYTSRTLTRKSGESGGAMDDVLKRLGAVESSVSGLRVQVSGIAGTMATKDDVNKLQVQVSGIAATIPYLATKDDLKELQAQVSGTASIIPYLATKDDLKELQAQVSGIAATMATKDELNKLQVQVSGIAANMAPKDELNKLQVQVSGTAAAIPYLATKADLSAMETTIIKWIIATVLTSVGLAGGLAFSIARFVH